MRPPVSVSIAALLLAACGGEKTTAPGTTAPPKPVASVQVTPSTHTLAALGATQQFQAVAKDADGATVSGKTFTWASSEMNVATIDASSGIATAVTNGSTSITATTDGVSGAASLTVAQTSNALMMRTQPAGASAGQPFTTQPVVEVHDANGNVAENDNSTVVTAAIASGGGPLLGTTMATATSGVVTFADLTIGGTVGDRTLTFTAQGLMAVTSGSFALAPGPATQMALDAGNNQTALAATAVTFSVKVTDAFDNGVPSVSVAWSVTSGSGTLASVTSTTDASGLATNTYTLGRFAAIETVAASAVLAGSPVAFSATATPNGTVSGTITVSDALLAPPQAPKAATVDAVLVRPSGFKRSPKQARRVNAPARVRTAVPSAPEYVPDELIVTFRSGPLSAPPVGAAAMAVPVTARAIANSIRVALAPHVQPGRLAVTGVSPAILAARVKVANPSELDAVAAELRANPSVSVVERNPIVRLDKTAGSLPLAMTTAPNDPIYPWQAWHYAMIDLPEAWSITTGNASVLVAVLDDGIRFDHPGIAANLSSDGYDFVANTYSIDICSGGTIGRSADGDGYDSDPTNPADYVIDPVLNCILGLSSSGNHGLHVAGTIGAVGNDAAGVTGVNWTVQIRPVRVCGIDGCVHYDQAQGILYAAGLPADNGAGGMVQASTGAKVINMSLGGPASNLVQQNAVISATAAGALIVAAAGNDASSVPNYPAAYPQTLSVSAMGPDGVLASYSSFGSTVDIAAPGGDLVDGGASFGVMSTAWDYVSSVPIYDNATWNGTSMAAPHVSGVAALLLAQNPTLTAADLKARLINYAVDVGAAGRDDFYGYGIVNARNSLTQSFAPTQQLFARLTDANSGALVQTVAAQPDGSYAFTELADTDYLVYAGQDADGDLQIGIPNRRWGALGGSATPTPVTVSGAGTYPATFSMGLPIEVEPNDVLAQADVVPIGGYLFGTISDPATDGDAMLVQIPADGQYTFETSAVDGACGFALEEDTILQLFNSSGTQIAVNDDIDFAGANFCSRISIMLSAGTHYVGITGYFGGRYAIAVREGI